MEVSTTTYSPQKNGCYVFRLYEEFFNLKQEDIYLPDYYHLVIEK